MTIPKNEPTKSIDEANQASAPQGPVDPDLTSPKEELEALLNEVERPDLEVRSFEATLDAWIANKTIKPGQLKMLSVASASELAYFKTVWAGTAPKHRQSRIQDLVDLAEADALMDFRPLFEGVLDDEIPEVRASAIEGLWEAEDRRFIDTFHRIVEIDTSDLVRASAARALGTFIQRAALGELPERRVAEAVDALLEVARDEREDPETRRRALAAVAYSEHEDLPALIEAACESDDRSVVAGALRAMGNSADESWSEKLVSYIDSHDSELRFEAVRSAGELEVEQAIPLLASLAAYESDRQIQRESIWALGEIGGKKARRVLDDLAGEIDEDSEDLMEVLEDAIGACELKAGEFSVGNWSDFDLDE